MRVILPIAVFILFSCNNRPQTDLPSQKRFEFQLIDSLGTVSIAIPERMDTFFTWIQRSDCGWPCEHGDYRFQSKKNRIFKESGFYWTGEPEDSVDQLTIYHQRTDTILPNRDSILIKMRDRFLDKVLNGFETKNVLSDTLIKVGDRHFFIFRIANINNKTDVRDRRLIAFTTISGWELEFHYKLLTKRYDTVLTQFFNKSLENLKSVRLKDGG